MNILSSALPGLRELRAPLASGAIWFAAIALFFGSSWDELTAKFEVLGGVETVLAGVSEPYLIAALAFVAYLVGALTVGVGDILARVLDWIGLGAGKFLANMPKARILGPARNYGREVVNDVRGTGYSISSPVVDAVSDSFVRAGASSVAAFGFPAEILLEKFDSLALQMWNAAPTQYQEYDRLKAEATFRVAVLPPIIAVGAVLTFTTSWIALPIALTSIAILHRQARVLRRTRNELMANVLYLGLAHSALLDAVAEDVALLGVKATVDGEWLAATAVALQRRGEYEAALDALDTLVDYTWDPENNQEIEKSLEMVGQLEPDLARVLTRKIDDRSKRYLQKLEEDRRAL